MVDLHRISGLREDQRGIVMQLTAESLGTYLQRLEEEFKIHPIGDGGYSVVYDHPTEKNVIVKITIDDPVYMSYVAFCRRNPLNRWLPHIWDVKKIELTSEPHRQVWAVFMPRLKRASEKFVSETFQVEIAPWVDFKAFTEKRRLSYPQWRYVLRMAEDPDTKVLAAFLLRNFRYLDLHARNFMTRPGNEGEVKQLVFNDPIARQV